MRVLVTGATGFIGGHLLRSLVAQGNRVRALVRHENRGLALAGAGVELVWGDLTDLETVRAAVSGVEAVCHLAAVRDAWGIPASVYQRVNVEGTRHLLEAAAETGVHRFLYCSSVGVACYPGNLEADETLPFREPTSQVFYHRSKAQAERTVLEWARAGRVPAVVVRPVIAYGPEDEHGMVPCLIRLLARGRFLLVGNGHSHVDLVYVDDLVAGMCLALEQGAVERVYILSGTGPIQVRTLVARICRLLGRRPPPIHVPLPIARAAGWGMETLYGAGGRQGVDWAGRGPFITRDKVATLTMDWGFSHARARQELGYRPQVEHDEGLRRTLDWLQETEFLPRNLVSGLSR